MPFGVSNSFKRGTVTTYSRRKARADNAFDAERPRKRICMAQDGEAVEQSLEPKHLVTDETGCVEKNAHSKIPEDNVLSSAHAPSSPLSDVLPIFSSDPAEAAESDLSSPSSSPKPVHSPVKPVHKPAFAVLKKKKTHGGKGSGSLALSEMSSNIQKMPATQQGKKAKTQMQIDLGGEIRKTCRVCGMEYVPSVREDSALHKEFCSMNIAGIELGKPFLKDETLKQINSEKTNEAASESVVLVDRRCSVNLRCKVKRVLSVVNKELSAPDIDEDALWGLQTPLAAERLVSIKRRGQQIQSEVRDDRFKSFLYLIGDRCIGFCLAEKISQAFQVVDIGPEGPRNDSTLAILGISRIWVSKAFRRKGVATNLLRGVQNDFFYGLQIPKALIAFSQPTASGGQLAEKWFGMKTGWHVYSDGH